MTYSVLPGFNGAKLKELRLERNWTHRDLAEKVGVVHPNISRWEGGKSLPRRVHVEKLAKIFKVKLGSFFGNGGQQ